MRRTIALPLVLAAVAAVLAVPASAAPIKNTLKGSFTPAKLEKMCIDRGGTYTQSGSSYGCNSGCMSSSGAPSLCEINCKGSKCVGTTPG